MKQVYIAAQVFAFLTLLFVPSILLMVGLGYLVRNTSGWLFGMSGITVFMINLAYVLTGDRRVRLWRKLNAISGIATRP